MGKNGMKGKKGTFITVISLFLIIAVPFAIVLCSGTSYLKIVKMNWDISLPANGKEIYQAESGASSHGDGLRYHVFQYKTDLTLKGLVPGQDFSQADTGKISWILSQLHVKKEYYPDFNHITFSAVQRHSDSSQLYLCCSPQKTLYVIEAFY